MSNHRISAVICAKNEAKSITGIIQKVKSHVDEILVIDGHSTDETSAISSALGCKVIRDNGGGKGEGLRLGLSAATGDYIVCIDADGSHDPGEIPRIVDLLKKGEADLVIGSRKLGRSEELDGTWESFLRDFFGNLITGIINLRFGTGLTDSQNGLRALRKEIIPTLNLSENSFTIEQQMCIRCLKEGLIIKEIPSVEYRRQYGVSHISLLKHGPVYAWCLLREMMT